MNQTASEASSDLPREPHFKRSLGLLPATAINMTQMCGIGPFITIPLAIAAMHGPQAMIGWIIGAILVMADGLVWAELGAAMPGAGGTYLYLREAFQYRTGKLMPFLFVWTAMIFIPLIMSTGVIGMLDYLGYYFPNFTAANIGATKYWLVRGAMSTAIVAVVVFALYRNVKDVGRLATALWIIMFVTVAAVILASFTHFDPKLAFTFPAGAFTLNGDFFAGLGAVLVVAVYDYLGYNTTAYMAAELREPGRTIPRSIVFSIVSMMVIYLVMNIGILGVLPWQESVKSSRIASDVLEHCWGKSIAQIVTGLIIITAFGSVFTGILGGSRVPFEAAKDKVFLPMFGRLHARDNFPHIALIAMGVITAIGSFFDLTTVIAILTAVMVLIQCIAQVAALFLLRSRQPQLNRPYRMFLYPLPAIMALAGWIYLYYATTKSTDSAGNPLGLKAIWMSVGWVVLGVIAFLVWARMESSWPFGPIEIREEFASQATPEL
jgi:amino acid transporter